MLATAVVSSSRAQRMPTIQVGPNVQVSAARASYAHGELLAGADPHNPTRMIVCSMVDRESRKYPVTSVVYMTADGGATWTPVLNAEKLGYPYMSDPKCAFGPDGIVYYSGYGTNPQSPYSKDAPNAPGQSEYFFSSRDGGKTWSKPTALIGNRLGRASLAIDNSNGPRRGTIYWDGVVVVPDFYEKRFQIGYALYQSTDQGRHFQSSVLHAPVALMEIGLLGGNSVVLTDGTFVSEFTSEGWPGDDINDDKVDGLLVSGDTSNHDLSGRCNLFATTSTDGGLSITPPVLISGCHRTEAVKEGHSTAGFPALAADLGKGPRRDQLYLVWADNSSGRHNVMLTKSSDHGATWSVPQQINDDPTPPNPMDGPDMIHPNVAVNLRGVIGVSWAQRESIDGSGDWKVHFRASADGAETWAPSVLVTEPIANTRAVLPDRPAGSSERARTITTMENVTNPTQVFFEHDGGHTWSMVADAGGTFHPFWVDNRTAIFQVWTASITVSTAVKTPTRQ